MVGSPAENHCVPSSLKPLNHQWHSCENIQLKPEQNYHLEHHLVGNCPQYNLPIAHQMLVDKGYLPRMEVQSGYPAVLRLAVS